MISSVLLISSAAQISCSRETPSDLEPAEARTQASLHRGARTVGTLPDAKSDHEDRGVIERLRSKEPEIVARALAESRRLVTRESPDMQLVDAIVELAGEREDGATRYAIVETLGALEAAHRDAKVLGVLESYLRCPEPQVLSSTLRALQQGSDGLQSPELRVRVLELAEHQDPGVRGQALRLLGQHLGERGGRPVPPWPPEGTGWGPRNGVQVWTSPKPKYLPISLGEATIARAWAALEDPHPYVRAEACEALARLGYIQAIHGLIGLVDDHERSAYELAGWTLLDGQPGSVRHEIPGRSYVGESAMAAVQALSAGQLDLEPIDPTRAEESQDANARSVRGWYTKHARDRVPLASPEPVFPAKARYRRTPPSGLH